MESRIGFIALALLLLVGAAGATSLSLVIPGGGAPTTTGAASAGGTGLSQYCGNVNTAGAAAIVSTTAQWYCTQINAAAIAIWAHWEPIAFAAALFSFMIAAVLMMLGIGIRNERIRIFGVGELYEAIATSIIVILFTFFAAVMFGVVPGFFVGPINPYSTSLTYISHTIAGTGLLIQELYQIGAVDYFYSSQTLSTCIGSEVEFECQEEFNFFPPLFRYGVIYLFFWPAASVLDLLIPGFMALHLEFYAIVFMMYAALPVFFVPGIIFRALMPTRHLGGMLMAVAIGFYFFMPILFSIAYGATAGTQNGALSQMNAITSALGRYGGCTAGSASCASAVANSASPTSPLVEQIATAPSALGSFWLSVLFYPALISAMTYAFITQMAELFGGMARTSTRLRGL